MTERAEGDREVAFSTGDDAPGDGAGIIAGYTHPNGRLGSLVEVTCGSAALAARSEFRRLAHEVALQVAAAAPRWIDRAAVPPEAIVLAQAGDDVRIGAAGSRAGGAPSAAEAAFYRAHCLMEQPWVKDPSRTVRQWLEEASARWGEPIAVRRFARFERPHIFCTWYQPERPDQADEGE